MKKIIGLFAILVFNSGLLFAQNQQAKAENLGPNINTIYEERNPVIAPDGKTLFFVRQGDPMNYGEKVKKNDQDIWYSTLKSDGSWSKAINIGSTLNNRNNNAVLSVTPDGNTLLLFGVYDSVYTYGGASISRRTQNGWSDPVKLKSFVNFATWYQFYLCNDDKTLILSIQNKNTHGLNDIYVSFRKNNNDWTEPLNLGPIVNTKGNEITPFLASDGVSLYYSTNGIEGYGDYDVFVTRRLDSTWQNWSKPENLGPKINTPGFDGYYKIDAKGEYAYFTSTFNSFGQGDIFRIELPKAVKPLPVVLIYGKVINAKTKEPIECSVVYEILPDGKEVGQARSSPLSGDYKITLPAGAKYGFRAEAKGYISINDNLDLTGLTEYMEINRDLELVPLEEGIIVRLNNIFFDFDQAILRSESIPELTRVISFLNENPTVEIEISGHTDSKGTDAYNKKLSEDRVKAVAEYIYSQNIPESRVKYKGYGKSQPISTNDTEEGRQLNRRVEFKILKK